MSEGPVGRVPEREELTARKRETRETSKNAKNVKNVMKIFPLKEGLLDSGPLVRFEIGVFVCIEIEIPNTGKGRSSEKSIDGVNEGGR